MWAVELKKSHELIGFIGLNYTNFSAHFTPAVKVGWRLCSKFGGKGYATEGANAALRYGFKVIGLEEIVSFTFPMNKASINVMEELVWKEI